MITVTTVGYGDIVPVTDRARMFDTFLVTPIRIFVWLIFLGTAYQFLLRNVWEAWVMSRIQDRLHDHVVVAGFGTSGEETVRELIRRGVPGRADRRRRPAAGGAGSGRAAGGGGARRRRHPQRDPRRGADRPRPLRGGLGRARRHLDPDRPDRPRHGAAGRRSAWWSRPRTTRTWRTRPAPPRSSTRRASPGCCSPGRRTGRTSPSTWPTSRPPTAASRCASGRSPPQEAGRPLSAIGTGLGVRVYRGGKSFGFWDIEAAALQAGDTILEIVPRARGAALGGSSA